jgi:hypothetical protein
MYPERDKHTSVIRIAKSAINEYPPFLSLGDATSPGVAILLDIARKASLIKVEKLVKLPQNPVARPIYNGIVFFVARCAFFAAARSTGGLVLLTGAPFSSSPVLILEGAICCLYVAVPHSWRNSLRSSTRKPRIKLPAKLAQRVEYAIGVPGYRVTEARPTRARVPRIEKRTR